MWDWILDIQRIAPTLKKNMEQIMKPIQDVA